MCVNGLPACVHVHLHSCAPVLAHGRALPADTPLLAWSLPLQEVDMFGLQYKDDIEHDVWGAMVNLADL